jgi:flavin reductase (DIM6/NTAB) family NADH-FMN oxidoreductase RutF
MTKPLRPDASAAPASGGSPAHPVSGLAFREGMSRVAAAVHLVTTDGPGGLAGLTVTAVTAVSDEPPTLLVCIHKDSHSAPRLRTNGVFCVNTLAPSGRHLAEVFSGRTGVHLDRRFGEGQWTTLATGAPVLATALAVFDCRVVEIRDIATHLVVLGEVVAVRLDPDADSLLYRHRAYHAIG